MYIKCGVVLASIILIGVSSDFCFTRVKTGEVGIQTRFGKPLERAIPRGFHFVPPTDEVIKLNTFVRVYSHKFQVRSSDEQRIYLPVTVNYQLDEAGAFKIVDLTGPSEEDAREKILIPALMGVVFKEAEKVTLEDMVANKDKLATSIRDGLEGSFEGNDYPFKVVSVTISNINYPENFEVAAKQKNDIEMELSLIPNKLKKAENEKSQLLKKAEADAKVLEAQAKAFAEMTVANAIAEAEAIKALGEAVAKGNAEKSKFVTQDYVNAKAAEKWQEGGGKYPEYIANEGQSVLQLVQ